MRQRVFLGLLILFIVLGIFSIVYAVMNPGQSIFSYISGSATVVIAILTMAYVYVTSRQLDVMANQLEEMKIERKLQNQPLPYISNISVWIEKPRFFFSPPGPWEQYSVNARCWAKIRIRNIGSHPAVCIDVSGRIEIPNGDKKRYFVSTSINIPAIGEKENYPVNDGDDDEFLFGKDDEGVIIEALRESNVNRLPLLDYRILFRNIMGGCFLLSCKYRLYRKREEDGALLSNWLAEMKSFSVKYKNEIENLRKLEESHSEKRDEEFVKLKESFSKSISGEDVKLSPWLIPGSFMVKPLSVEEYEKALGDVSYGVKIGAGPMECVAQ